MLSVVMLSAVMLSTAFFIAMLSAVMLGVIMLSVILQGVVMLSVIKQGVVMLIVMARTNVFFKMVQKRPPRFTPFRLNSNAITRNTNALKGKTLYK
jgi:hypothetical protein